MREMFNYLRTRYMSEKAQGMAEYALVLAFVVVVVAFVTTDNSLTDAIKSAFTKVSGQIAKDK